MLNMARRVNLALFVMGFGGLIAEILLLRELVVVFSGNELCIGIVLGNWLLLEALGCLLSGRLAAKTRRVPEAYALLSALFSAALPAAVIAVRLLKRAWGVSLGEPLGLEAVFLSSFLILLPVGVLHGAQFTLGCRLHARLAGCRRESAARVYAIESAGTLAAGLAGTFLLFPYLNAFRTAATVVGLNAVAGLLLLAPANRQRRLAFRVVPWLFLLASGWLLFGGLADRLHDLSVRAQWRRHNVVYHRNSRHSHIAVIENQGQYTFFLDGVPSLMIPVPHAAETDVFAHLPLLCHPRPERVLIVGGGAGGVIAATLMHRSVRSVDYVEMDPLLPELLRVFSTPLTESELSDPRVTVLRMDGRRRLHVAEDRYDVLFVGIPEPTTLQANRFFTREFFALAGSRLRDRGILVLGLPGSLALVDDELTRLQACIYFTLREVFPHVRAFPGEGRHLFLASAAADITGIDAGALAARRLEPDAPAVADLPWHVENRLHPGWQDWFGRHIADVGVTLNRDFQPLGLYYSTRRWIALSSPAIGTLLRKLEGSTPRAAAALVALLAMIACLRARGRQAMLARLTYTMATTGFAGMIFGLAAILAFQTVHGYVVSWIGLLVAGHMAGSACGAWRAGRPGATAPGLARRLALNELAILLFAMLLPLLVQAAVGVANHPAGEALVPVLFLTASFLAGGLTAHEFPLANALCSRADADPSRAAGRLYALDLLGGWLGGMIGSVFLLPVLGLQGTCVLLGILKLAGFFLMATACRASGGAAATG